MESKDESSFPWGVQLPSFKRPDGRTSYLQLRPPACELGVLKNANGSARFKMGLTSALAAVYGPREVGNQRRSLADRGSIQVIVRPLFGSKGLSERYSDSTLTPIMFSVIDLPKLVRTNVSIILQPEGDDGGLLSCLINAAMCALLDSGIPLKSTYLSVPLVRLKMTSGEAGQTNYVLDPTTEELSSPNSECDPSTFVAFTIDLHSNALVQINPELVPPLQQEALNSTSHSSLPSYAGQWGLTVEMLNSGGACCSIFAEVVRKAVESKLDQMVTRTFCANCFTDT